jgi:hypothetical protein
MYLLTQLSYVAHCCYKYCWCPNICIYSSKEFPRISTPKMIRYCLAKTASGSDFLISDTYSLLFYVMIWLKCIVLYVGGRNCNEGGPRRRWRHWGRPGQGKRNTVSSELCKCIFSSDGKEKKKMA